MCVCARVCKCWREEEKGVENWIEFLQLASRAVTQSDAAAGVQRAPAIIKLLEAQQQFKALARSGDTTWRPERVRE